MVGYADLLMLGGGGSGGGSDILSLLMQSQMSPIQSLAQALPAYNYTKKYNQYLAPAQETLDAMGDITNPKYQQIYGQQKQQGQDNLAYQIAELGRQNRKLSMLGRTPLFSAERGGETLFRGLTQGYQDIQNKAGDQTQNILANLFKNQSAMGLQRAQYGAQKASVKGGMYGSLAKLFGL